MRDEGFSDPRFAFPRLTDGQGSLSRSVPLGLSLSFCRRGRTDEPIKVVHRARAKRATPTAQTVPTDSYRRTATS